MSTTNNFTGDALVNNEENILKQERQKSVIDSTAVQECAGDEEVTDELPEDDVWMYDTFPEEGEPPEEEVKQCSERPPSKSFVSSPITKNQSIKAITRDFLSQFDRFDQPDPEYVEGELLGIIKDEFHVINAHQDKSARWPIPSVLPNAVIADILVKLHGIVRLRLGTETQKAENDPIGIYMLDGPDKGIYSTDEAYFASLCLKYNYSATDKDCAEIYKRLKKIAPCVQANDDSNLIAVNNGIFNYKTKKLLPFTPDKVFLTKCPVDYKPNASNPVIADPDTGEEWDVESWMKTLSDEPEVVNLLWEAMGAAIRPGIPWDKALFLISPVGGNGKGTWCQLLRSLCGSSNCVSMQLADMGNKFIGGELLNASTIITDENDVCAYLEKAALFKAIVTHDVVRAEEKYKQGIAFRFRGFMVQCFNDMPEFKDKSNSLFRRILVIWFHKSFVNTGTENKRIKSDYINRKEVLEYVLHRVLHMDYYELSEPESCKMKKEELRESNNAILQFAGEILPQVVWDLQPFEFLYDVYKVWMEKNVPNGKPVSRNKFTREIKAAVDQYQQWGWTYLPDSKEVRTKGMMDKPEPLLLKYDLKNWMNDSKSIDYLARCRPLAKDKYRGLTRTSKADAIEVVDPDKERLDALNAQLRECNQNQRDNEEQDQ